MLLIMHGMCIALFLVLGFVFSRGKGTFLIAGYNTAPRAEKEKIDEKKLCQYMARLMFALAACWSVTASSEIFHATWLLWVGQGLFLAVTIGGIIYINTGGRLKK